MESHVPSCEAPNDQGCRIELLAPSSHPWTAGPQFKAKKNELPISQRADLPPAMGAVSNFNQTFHISHCMC